MLNRAVPYFAVKKLITINWRWVLRKNGSASTYTLARNHRIPSFHIIIFCMNLFLCQLSQCSLFLFKLNRNLEIIFFAAFMFCCHATFVFAFFPRFYYEHKEGHFEFKWFSGRCDCFFVLLR